MGTYPDQYPAPAIKVAEDLVLLKFRERLHQDEWTWTASPYLLSVDELESIRLRFVPGVADSTLERFIGLVFSKKLPLLHLQFRTDGYLLTIEDSLLTIREQPASFYGTVYNHEAREAAFRLVRSLIEWRLAHYNPGSNQSRWPLGEQNQDLILSGYYPWIDQIGEIGYTRTSYVIDFVHKAVPDLRSEWESEGLALRPVYHDYTSTSGKCVIALQLVPKQSV